MNCKLILIGALLGASCAAPSVAQDTTQELASRVFSSININQDDLLSFREVMHFQDLVFLSMDSDEDHQVSPAEFMAWDTVWVFSAGQQGEEYRQSMQEAKQRLFDGWDVNKDGALLEGEHEYAILLEWSEAETDGKTGLSLDEFSSGFSLAQEFSSVVSTDQ